MTPTEHHLPPARTSQSPEPYYPWLDMAVGDFFHAPADRWVTVRVAAHQFGRRHGLKFETQKVSADKVRCRRTA